MTRMAGFVRTMGLSLALGCGRTGPRVPRLSPMWPEAAATLTRWDGWGVSGRHPHGASLGSGRVRHPSLRPRQLRRRSCAAAYSGQVAIRPGSACGLNGLIVFRAADPVPAPKWEKTAISGGSARAVKRSRGERAKEPPLIFILKRRRACCCLGPADMIIRDGAAALDGPAGCPGSRRVPGRTPARASTARGRGRRSWMFPLIPITLMVGLAGLKRTILAIQSFGLINTFRTLP